MGTTPLGFPFPADSVRPDVPLDISALATALDTFLAPTPRQAPGWLVTNETHYTAIKDDYTNWIGAKAVPLKAGRTYLIVASVTLTDGHATSNAGVGGIVEMEVGAAFTAKEIARGFVTDRYYSNGVTATGATAFTVSSSGTFTARMRGKKLGDAGTLVLTSPRWAIVDIGSTATPTAADLEVDE